MFFFVKIAFALLSFKRKAVQFCCLPPHGGSGLKFICAILRRYANRLPPHGGSGLKYDLFLRSISPACLPPHGGSGLKFVASIIYNGQIASPSTRREWIEMALDASILASHLCLPPHGGSGLKSVRHRNGYNDGKSPSTRREWIEMLVNSRYF